MRILWCLWIDEKESRLCCLRAPNRPLAVILALMQLAVATASLSQHIFSIYTHRHVFLCRSTIDDKAPIQVQFLAYDIIIFDFGLMQRVLGTEECVANYLDGGYMRFLWCMEHVSALTLTIFALTCMSRPLWLLWPGLLIQSSYSLGLSVLTMATAPKLLEALGGRVDLRLSIMFFIYVFGFSFNWLFTFVLWHHYWRMEKIFCPPPAPLSPRLRIHSPNVANRAAAAVQV